MQSQPLKPLNGLTSLPRLPVCPLQHMWDHGTLGVWAERLPDGAGPDRRRQQRQLRVTKAKLASTRILDDTVFYSNIRTTHSPPGLCFQMDGSQLHSALRHDAGRGHPLPPGYTEAVQDGHEHEWDAGTGRGSSLTFLLLRLIGQREVPKAQTQSISVDAHFLCSGAFKTLAIPTFFSHH